jgi:amino acid transporter
MYISVLFVIVLYGLVAVVTVGSLPVASLTHARDYALAEAARPALGAAGFTMIGIAAMLSTASAINATLYGSARMTYTIAKSRELPAQLELRIWNQPLEGLLITAGATIALANVLNLNSISTMGSAGILIVFATVNAAEARTARQRGSAPWISVLAATACAGALAALVAKSTAGAVSVWSPCSRSPSASRQPSGDSPAPAPVRRIAANVPRRRITIDIVQQRQEPTQRVRVINTAIRVVPIVRGSA